MPPARGVPRLGEGLRTQAAHSVPLLSVPAQSHGRDALRGFGGGNGSLESIPVSPVVGKGGRAAGEGVWREHGGAGSAVLTC